MNKYYAECLQNKNINIIRVKINIFYIFLLNYIISNKLYLANNNKKI